MDNNYSLGANPYLATKRIYCDSNSGIVPDSTIQLFKSAGVEFNPDITNSNYPINHIINVAQIISDPLNKGCPKPENSESFINYYYKTLNKTIVQFKEVPKKSVTMLIVCSDSINDSVLGLKKAFKIGLKINEIYVLILAKNFKDIIDEVSSDIDKVVKDQRLHFAPHIIAANLLLSDAYYNADIYGPLLQRLENNLKNKHCMIACSYNSIDFIRDEFQKHLPTIGAVFEGIISVLTETVDDLPKEKPPRSRYIQDKYIEESIEIEKTKELWLESQGIYSPL